MRGTTIIESTFSRLAGFSPVDVVVVAALVGIIASFSVPRFTHLANSARAAQVIALGDNMRNAAEVAHAQYTASGATLKTVTVAGKSVELRNGYPDASGQGIGNAVFDKGGFTARADPSSVTFMKIGAPSGEFCAVTYRAAAPGVAADIVSVVTSGC
jgi:Tfp pilus assembly protein PilE